MKNEFALQNERVKIVFDAERNYCPISFADARAPEQYLFTLGAGHYATLDGELFSEAALPDDDKSVQLFDLVSQRRTRSGNVSKFTVNTVSPHLKLKREFELADDLPWLHARYTLQATGKPVKSSAFKLQAPRWCYGPQVENPLDADIIDFSFGRILPDGYEVPPYLTFWLQGRESGVLLWTENKKMMRRIVPRDETLDAGHPTLQCGSADLVDDEWDENYYARPVHWDFYLWPVRAGEWKAATKKLAAMRFKSWDPRRIIYPEKNRASSTSVTFSASDLASANTKAVSNEAAMKKWWHVQAADGRSLLFAQDPYDTPPLKIKHNLRGDYRIYVNTLSGSGLKLRLPDARYPIPMSQTHMHETPFHNALLAKPKSSELDMGVWPLNGGTLELHPLTSMYALSIIGGVRLEPAEAIETKTTTKKSNVFLCGIADAPDIAMQDGALTDAPYRANAEEHARIGFSRIYWRADGQCCDFHTKVGTVRYPLRRTHSVFNPGTLPYGMALRDYDLLTAAVETGHANGIEVYGYMRINGFGGNTIPKFYLEHPELHDEREMANKSSRLCYYLPEARRWKVEIAREIVRHQVDGLLIDTMRSPPMVDYHPAVVQAYLEKYGKLPPRNLDRGYIHYGIHPLETGKEWMRWWKFRAEGFTQFGRELRAMLKEEGKPDLPIHVNVRPQMALFDGTDIEAWVEEGLMDCLLVWPNIDTWIVPKEIFAATKGKIPVRCTVTANVDPKYAAGMMKVMEDKRYDGLNIYESNDVVWSPYHRAVVSKILHRD